MKSQMKLKELCSYFFPILVQGSKHTKSSNKKREQIRAVLPTVFQRGVRYGDRRFHLDITFHMDRYHEFLETDIFAPDIDNMLKFVLDAIKYKVIPDDKHVYSLTAKIEEPEGEMRGFSITVSEYYRGDKYVKRKFECFCKSLLRCECADEYDNNIKYEK